MRMLECIKRIRARLVLPIFSLSAERRIFAWFWDGYSEAVLQRPGEDLINSFLDVILLGPFKVG